MVFRTDLPRIPLEKEPSLLNNGLLDGAALGGAVGDMIGGFAKANRIWQITSILGGAAIGGAILSVRQKNLEEKQMADGKVAQHSGLLNMGTLSGAVATSLTLNMLELATKKPGLTTGWYLPLVVAGGALGSLLKQRSDQRDVNQAAAIKLQQESVVKKRIEQLEQRHEATNGAGEKRQHSQQKQLEDILQKGRNGAMSQSDKLLATRADAAADVIQR